MRSTTTSREYLLSEADKTRNFQQNMRQK